MKIRAIGRYLLVELNFDLIDAVTKEAEKNRKIVLPDEAVDRMKGGCQVSTILSVGSCAFDDASPKDMDEITVGRQILTSRYPGHAIDYDPYASQEQSTRMRLITCDEVHAVLCTEDEEGTDV